MSQINDGRGFRRKAKPIKDAEGYAEFLRTFPFCMCCHVPMQWAPYPGLSRHHIIKFKRSDDWCNLVVCCDRDHSLAELHTIREGGVALPKLTLGIMLTIKKEADPDNWNPERLEELRGQPLPELEPIPDFLLRDRTRWGGLAMVQRLVRPENGTSIGG